MLYVFEFNIINLFAFYFWRFFFDCDFENNSCVMNNNFFAKVYKIIKVVLNI